MATTFPTNFLWGSSTNAQQFEGGRNDDGTGDLHRVRKDSFFWYQRAIASDGHDLD